MAWEEKAALLSLAAAPKPRAWEVARLAALLRDWLRRELAREVEPCTEEMRGPKQALSSWGPSRVLGLPRFLFTSPLSVRGSWRPRWPITGRPIIWWTWL